MKVKLIITLFVLPVFYFLNLTENGNNETETTSKQSVYDFKVKDINGKTFDFSTLKGKKVLIVNTAFDSKLASSQLSQLEELYEKYKSKNFVIVAFPTNDFKSTNGVNNKDFKECYEQNYNVTFPVMEKITVKGKNKHELFKYLTDDTKTNIKTCGVYWDFQKYLINENGKLEKIIDPKVSPTDNKIVDWIVK